MTLFSLDYAPPIQQQTQPVELQVRFRLVKGLEAVQPRETDSTKPRKRLDPTFGDPKSSE